MFCPEHRLPENHNCPNLTRAPLPGGRVFEKKLYWRYRREAEEEYHPQIEVEARRRFRRHVIRKPRLESKITLKPWVSAFLILAILYMISLYGLRPDLFPFYRKPVSLYRKVEFILYSLEEEVSRKFSESFLTVEVNITDPRIVEPIVYAESSKQTIFQSTIDHAIQHPSIQKIAVSLILRSKGDPELYANYALQITHQMMYNMTKMIDPSRRVQHPVYTLYLSSGICIDYTLLYAAILRAGGLKVAILLVDVYSEDRGPSSHAMVAVKLPKPPEMPWKIHYPLYKRQLNYSYPVLEIGVDWYIAEPTPSVPPPSQSEIPSILLFPAFVGEHNWKNIKIKEIYIIS